MEIKQKRLRCYEKLPVIICEWHQHVLPFIHRGIASRHLPSTGLQILHFDAHPDLTFPVNKPAADCFDKDALYDQIEIADWILPLCFEGHLNRIIWVKPQWAEQIKHGDYFVQVGEDKVNGCLRVNWKDDYFLEELLYASDDNLLDAKSVRVHVRTLYHEKSCNNNKKQQCDQDETDRSIEKDCEKFEQTTKSERTGNCINQSMSIDVLEWDKSFILDIDLDFFSTYNPFKLKHSEEEFTNLTEIFKFKSPKSLADEHVAEATQERFNQLKTLQMTVLYFAQREKLLHRIEHFEFLHLICDKNHIVREEEIDESYYKLLQEIQERLRKDGKDIDLELVHYAGMSSDLPHHKSTTDEIDKSLAVTEKLLLSLPKPLIITIARSTEDNYTPADQANCIQEKVIKMLERLYSNLSLTKDYEN